MKITWDTLENRFFHDSLQPFTVSCGLGLNSVAMLVAMVRAARDEGRSEFIPELITFADVGSEREQTYEYLPVLNEYLYANGFPTVSVVFKPSVKRPKYGYYHTLEEECLVKKMLPSLAYGFNDHGCSIKGKQYPQNKLREKMPFVQRAWANEIPTIVAIGYDAGDADTDRANRFDRNYKTKSDDKYTYWHPLRDLGWDRGQCEEEVAREGLPLPIKSSCFFCPAVSEEELTWYSKSEQGMDYLRRIVRMEENVKRNRGVEGYMTQTELDGRHHIRLAKWEDKMELFQQKKLLNKKGELVKNSPSEPKRKMVGDKNLISGLWASKTMTSFIKKEKLLDGKKRALPILQQFNYPQPTCGLSCPSCKTKCTGA
jgi:hypothetical protein